MLTLSSSAVQSYWDELQKIAFDPLELPIAPLTTLAALGVGGALGATRGKFGEGALGGVQGEAPGFIVGGLLGGAGGVLAAKAKSLAGKMAPHEARDLLYALGVKGGLTGAVVGGLGGAVVGADRATRIKTAGLLSRFADNLSGASVTKAMTRLEHATADAGEALAAEVKSKAKRQAHGQRILDEEKWEHLRPRATPDQSEARFKALHAHYDSLKGAQHQAQERARKAVGVEAAATQGVHDAKRAVRNTRLGTAAAAGGALGIGIGLVANHQMDKKAEAEGFDPSEVKFASLLLSLKEYTRG